MAKNATPRKVDWMEPSDLRVVMLGQLGISTKKIMEETELSHCQVTYRLNKSQTKRSDYRNGTSEFAQKVIERMQMSDATIRGMIKAKLKTKGH